MTDGTPPSNPNAGRFAEVTPAAPRPPLAPHVAFAFRIVLGVLAAAFVVGLLGVGALLLPR